MKSYSTTKIYIRGIYLFMTNCGINLKKTYFLIINFHKFIRDLIKFKKKGGKINVIYPFFDEFSNEAREYKNQFFHADLLIAQNIYNKKPLNHLDIGSRVDGFVAHIASYRKLDFIDIRSVNLKPHKNINTLQMDIAENNLKHDKKYSSISSLGVIGHIGLGRYGDKVNPDGYLNAINNICNFCDKNGNIYIMVPVGRKKVAFNSHRVFDPKEIIEIFEKNDCELNKFSLVDDFGDLQIDCQIKDSINLNFGGGIFEFKKN